MTDPRDDLEIDALVTDRYLDSLLASRERGMSDPGVAPEVDPAARSAAQALHRQLSRVHPSFRFEERLAADLAAQVSRARRGRATRPAAVRRLDAHQSAAPHVALPMQPAANRLPRPLLIGGALTSAALSIAGAYVAWRRGRPPLDPMVRAVRAAHRAGLASRIAARPGRTSRRAGLGR